MLLEELSDDLLDSVHTKPIATVDQGVSPSEFGHKGLVKVWLIWEIQLRYTSLGDDATVICLRSKLVRVLAPTLATAMMGGSHAHDGVISPRLFWAHITALSSAALVRMSGLSWNSHVGGGHHRGRCEMVGKF